MNKKVSISVGMFVSALFIISAIPTNATVIPPNQPVIPGIQYRDDNVNFPTQLPPGVSSLTIISTRHAIDIWHLKVWDVGYSIWIMRLRDGNSHNWAFNYQMSITYAQGEQPQTTTIQCDPITWNTFVFPGFDIYRYSFVSLPGIYYTAELNGIVVKDSANGSYCLEPHYKYFNGFLFSIFNELKLNEQSTLQ